MYHAPWHVHLVFMSSMHLVTLAHVLINEPHTAVPPARDSVQSYMISCRHCLISFALLTVYCFQALLVRTIAGLRRNTAARTDERVRLTGEVIQVSSSSSSSGGGSGGSSSRACCS
jgi:hypothetical protein